MKRKLISLLLTFLLLCALCGNIYAHEVPDLSRKGSISITMRVGEIIVPGGAMTLYRVGQIDAADGNYCFVLTDDFAGSCESLEDVGSSQLALNLAEFAADNELLGTQAQIGDDGKVVFSDLELGLYLMVQHQGAEGYNAVRPFLVSVPKMEDGVYVYDVDAGPKVTLTTAPTEPSETEPTETKPDDPKLPQTGQLNWPVPMMAVLGLGLFTLGCFLCVGSKKENDEKQAG